MSQGNMSQGDMLSLIVNDTHSQLMINNIIYNVVKKKKMKIKNFEFYVYIILLVIIYVRCMK